MSDEQDAVATRTRTRTRTRANQPPGDTVLNDGDRRRTPLILRLSQEILDEIAVSVGSGGYHIENCPESCFAPKEWVQGAIGLPRQVGLSSEAKNRFAKYRASKRGLMSMTLCCRSLSESAQRVLYQHAIISRPQQPALLLRTLVLRPHLKKRIKHLELSCKANGLAGTQQDFKYKVWGDIATTESFPWLGRLQKEASKAENTYAQVLTLLYLALLYNTPRLKTIYCLCPPYVKDMRVLVSSTRPLLMTQIQEFAESHVLCPRLEQVYISTNGHAAPLECFQPLLALGQVSRVTAHNARLDLASHFGATSGPVSGPSIVETNMLQNIQELTLDDFALLCYNNNGAFYRSFDVFVQAKKVRVLRLGDDWESKRFSRSPERSHLFGLLSLLRFPSLPALQTVEIDISRRTLSQFMMGFKKAMGHSHMTTLRVPLKGLFGDYGWLGKGHPVHDTPQKFISRIVIPETEQPTVFPPRLAKLILVVTDGGRPRSCGTFDLSQWTPWDQAITRAENGHGCSYVRCCAKLHRG